MFINFPRNSTCQTIRIHPFMRSNSPGGLVFHCSTTYHISDMSMESDYRNDVRHTDKFEDYWQTFNITSNLAQSSIPPPKANNTNNTKQNRTTNQKPMTKSYPTLPKWNIAPWKQRMVSLYQHCSGALAVGFREAKETQQLLQRWFKMTLNVNSLELQPSNSIPAHVGFTIPRWSHPGLRRYPRNMRSSDAMEISMNSSSISTAKSWFDSFPAEIVVARVVQGLYYYFLLGGMGCWGRDGISFWNEWYNTFK